MSERGRHRRKTGGRRRWVGRTAAAASVAVGLVTAAVQPAQAATVAPEDSPLSAPLIPELPALAPGIAPGPDSGSAPRSDGDVPLPALPDPVAAPPTDVIGPLAAEIIAISSVKEGVGEQLKAVNEELAAAHARTTSAKTDWDRATAEVATVREKADSIAADVYKDATALGPFQGYANDLQMWGLVAPALPLQVSAAARPPDRDSVAFELEVVERAEADAKAIYDAFAAAENEVTGRQSVLTEQFNRHAAALNTLRTRNDTLSLSQADAARDAWESSLATSFGLSTSVNGMQAGPRALAARAFALSQLGRPYEWAAEGPFRYDCSGLTFASYASAGVRIPRVSRDQYRAGNPVLVSQLLPGDLLFFSTDRRDARKIHHVAMYLGDGKMVHAPTWGQVVKISPIWWSEYFGAARFVPAVPVPGGVTPSPTPTAAVTTAPPVITTPPATTPPATTAPPATTPPATTPPATTPPPTTPPAEETTPPPTTPPVEQTTPPPTTPPAEETTAPAATTPPPTTPPAQTPDPTPAPSVSPEPSPSSSPLASALAATVQPSAVLPGPIAPDRRGRWRRRRTTGRTS